MKKNNMKVVILAGVWEVDCLRKHKKPKTNVEIGGNQFMAHNEKLRYFNLNEFIICCGYKSIIKEYFANYALNN